MEALCLGEWKIKSPFICIFYCFIRLGIFIRLLFAIFGPCSKTLFKTYFLSDEQWIDWLYRERVNSKVWMWLWFLILLHKAGNWVPIQNLSLIIFQVHLDGYQKIFEIIQPNTNLSSSKSPEEFFKINPEYSLEGLMLKLKPQYSGHPMWRLYSLEKTLMLGRIEGRRRGQQRMSW